MSGEDRVRGGGLEDAYERYRQRAVGYLARHFPDVEPDERLSLYHEAWASVLRRQAAGDPVTDLEPYLIAAVKLAARHRRRTATSRKTEPTDPHDGPLAFAADVGPSVHERVATGIDAALARDIIASLDQRSRAVIKLRFDCGYEVDEIRSLLNLSERAYERVLERARATIAERVAEVHDGRRERRHRSLLLACELGIASPRQHERARRLISEDPRTRAMARQLRGLPAELGALLPVPALAGEDPGGLAEHLARALAVLKHHALGLSGRATGEAPMQIAAAGGLRGSGTVAAVVAACIAAGGAASYCVMEGVPAPLRDEAPPQRAEKEKKKRPPETTRIAQRRTRPEPRPLPAATPSPAARPARRARSSRAKRRAPERRASAPASAPQPEPPTASPQTVALGFERAGSGATASAPPSRPQPAPRPRSGPGEFGQP